ncbi:hypothetical protein [Paenibacillus sp. J2TS4]|uniref:hypothetical protein n=1 Tax=Paenibacillus sp. J2TS4 TaxID=2807194 RepID=UPI001B130709|nr:hypothetical protein [Paenibacillus sp. J2TS4]GIP33311.1 hypothetical protein J2TS4_25210 [Paenibacillus sp. J2TS4]
MFAKLRLNKAVSFLIGNFFWLVGFALFVWQIYYVSDGQRNMLLAGLSQHFMLPFVYIGTKLLVFSKAEVIRSNAVIILAYLSMLVTFSAGLLYSLIKHMGNRERREGLELEKH